MARRLLFLTRGRQSCRSRLTDQEQSAMTRKTKTATRSFDLTGVFSFFAAGAATTLMLTLTRILAAG
jgi:hypothetical protein